MQQLSSMLSLVPEHHSAPTVAPAVDATVPIGLLASRSSAAASSFADAEEQVERMAELSDSARRLNRPEQADRFLLLAWLAFESKAAS